MNPEQKLDQLLGELEDVTVEAEGRAFEVRGHSTLFRITGQAAMDEVVQLFVRARGIIGAARSTNRFRREVKANLRRTDGRCGSARGRP